MLSPQVLYDLDIMLSQRACLFDRLDHCKTDGGRDILTELCKLENATPGNILARQAAVKHICETISKWRCTISRTDVFYTTKYLDSTYAFLTDSVRAYRALVSFGKLFLNKGQYHFVLSGTKQVLQIISDISDLVNNIRSASLPPLLKEYVQQADNCLVRLNISSGTFRMFKDGEPSPVQVFETDKKIRGNAKAVVFDLLNVYYRLEALYSLAVAHAAMDLCFPVLTNDGDACSITALRHPLVKDCRENDVVFDAGKNVLIITGPNMAGKSTLMKSIGLAFFMANLGVGVAASAASMPLVDGILTSINIEDDITGGKSYFFNEVLSVRDIAIALQQHSKVVVIADELFKGTNIKDAFECTELVLNGFLNHRSHIFVLSTHLYELAEKFREHQSCVFGYFDAAIENGGIKCSYELRSGISAQRLGTRILRQQHVPELLGVEASF